MELVLDEARGIRSSIGPKEGRGGVQKGPCRIRTDLICDELIRLALKGQEGGATGAGLDGNEGGGGVRHVGVEEDAEACEIGCDRCR